LVHWQQTEPASEQLCSDYLQNTWGLDPSSFKTMSDPWFRNGGQQKRAQAPDGLIWTRRSAFTAEAPSTAANE
jgi:hypothetical protein